MKKTLLFITIFFLLVLSVPAFAGVAASSLDGYTFLRASADARAVVKTPGGELKVVRPGDEVAPGEKVVEIAPGRVVLEEDTANGAVTVIVRITDKGQKVQRIMRRAEPGPTLYAPSTVKAGKKH